MRKTRFPLTCILFVLSLAIRAQDISVDGALPGMILGFTNSAKKQYKSQMVMMNLQTTGHVWLKKEIDEAAEYQYQFDQYLKLFRKTLGYAAQVYGFYHEINNLSNNMGRLVDQIGEEPTNAIAVMLHNKRNDIYIDLINESAGIIKNIRQVCIDKKMTQQQRIELVFSIRPRLQKINQKLLYLVKLVRHTNLAMVWYEIEHGSLPHREGKAVVAEEALQRWKLNGNKRIRN